MAKFKCKHTGCVYEWLDKETIANMREHDEYEEVLEEELPKLKKPLKPKQEAVS